MSVYRFSKGDRITADRLNSIGDAVSCLQKVGSKEATAEETLLNSIPSALQARSKGNFDSMRAERLTATNTIKYRDIDKGTGDLPKCGQAGFYAQSPAVADIKGVVTRPNDAKLECLLSVSDIYLDIETNEYGCFSSAYYTTAKSESILWDKRKGQAGHLSVQAVKATVNPARPDEPLALNVKPYNIPVIPRDYSPCNITVGTRQTCSYGIVGEIKGGTAPIYGINTAGGIKITQRQDNYDCELKALSLETNVELYALACGDYNKHCGRVINDAGEYSVYGPYNKFSPYSPSSYKGGTVAKWPIIQQVCCGECVLGELSLDAYNISPWQIGYGGRGKIILPKQQPACCVAVGTRLQGFQDAYGNYISFCGLQCPVPLTRFNVSCYYYNLYGMYSAGYLSFSILQECCC